MNLRGFWKDANAGNSQATKKAKLAKAKRKHKTRRRLAPDKPAPSLLPSDLAQMRNHFRSI